MKFCDITSDNNRIREADAVVVNWNPGTVLPSPENRQKNQVWVFAQQNPFINFGNFTYSSELVSMNNMFNLSMGFWETSDINFPTGSLLFSHNYLSDDTKIEQGHRVPKLAVYCKSSNNESKSVPNLLVEALSTHLHIDEIKYCPDTVKRYSDPDAFYRQISKTYKFYLLFDDNQCNYYVPKTFFMLLKHGIVPVVLSANDYDFPPNVFINAMSFKSIRDLADFLILLDKNQRLYSNYFLWKRLHEVKVPSHQGLCDLCLKLTDGVKISSRRTKNDDPIDRILNRVPFCRKLQISDEEALIKDLQHIVSNKEDF